MKTGGCNEARILRICKSGNDQEIYEVAKDCQVASHGLVDLPFLRSVGVTKFTCARLFAKMIGDNSEKLFQTADEKMLAFLKMATGENNKNEKEGESVVRFDGDMVSGMFSLIYLLQDPVVAPQVCMILKPLQQTLKSQNYDELDFQKFAITWAYYPSRQRFTITVPGDDRDMYISQINKCLANKNRHFFFSLLAMQSQPRKNSNGQYSVIAHASTIFYDKQTGLLERFDPYEATNNITFQSRSLDNQLQKLFSGLDGYKGFVSPPYMKTDERKGLQWDQEKNKQHKKEGDPYGFCIPWSVLYAQARLHSPLQNPESIPDLLRVWVKKNNTSLTHFVREYTKKIENLGMLVYDKILSDTRQQSFVNNDVKLYKTILSILTTYAQSSEIF